MTESYNIQLIEKLNQLNTDSTPESLQSLLTIFRKEILLISGEIKSLIANNAFKTAQQQTHKLKVTTSLIGAAELYAATKALDECLEQGFVDKDIYENFQTILLKTTEFIK